MSWGSYKENFKGALDGFVFDEEILEIMKESRNNGQTIFLCGNGGSSSIAQHIACDLNKCAYENWKGEKKRFRAISLVGEVPYLTAIANDESYEDVFKEQLINLARPNDILILISSSGNSPNILSALKWGRENDLITIGLTGFSGGRLKDLCHYSAHVPVDDYGLAESVHDLFGHYLTVYLRGEKNE